MNQCGIEGKPNGPLPMEEIIALQNDLLIQMDQELRDLKRRVKEIEDYNRLKLFGGAM